MLIPTTTHHYIDPDWHPNASVSESRYNEIIRLANEVYQKRRSGEDYQALLDALLYKMILRF